MACCRTSDSVGCLRNSQVTRISDISESDLSEDPSEGARSWKAWSSPRRMHHRFARICSDGGRMTARMIYLRNAVLLMLAVLGAVWGEGAQAVADTATSISTCDTPIYAAARPPAARVGPIPIAENGWRSYILGVASYLRRCGGYVYATHQVYIDTRNLPNGHKVWIKVSTQRSDGVWAQAHRSAVVEVTARQRVEEVILHQTRGIGDGLFIGRVNVWHTATTPNSGALIPASSTLTADYQPWYGREASPQK